MTDTKNVGIWIRVSTDIQVESESPEHHEIRARKYAEAKGWNVITIYRLDALSGKSIRDYDETKRMLEDIKQGTISGIIFSKLARLARNTKELLEISELFREDNADLISLSESIDTSTPAGRLFFTVVAAMAQWEREEIADRVQKSVPIRASLGKPLGGQAPFGYEWKGNEFVINEKEAPIRKLMYEIFLKTKRKKTTAKELNALGYRTRNGSEFSGTTIGRLLEDTTAKGVRIANHTKSLGEGKKWIEKPKEDWIYIDCPAIITEDLWNSCNSILQNQHKERKHVGKKTIHLLSGIIECSCSSKMYDYYNKALFQCKKCKRKIEVSDIDEIYHEQLKQFLLTETDLLSYQQEYLKSILDREKRLTETKKEYDKNIQKLQKLANQRLEDDLSKEDFKVLYEPLKGQLRQLEKSIPELEAEIDFLKIQSLSTESIQTNAQDLYNKWKELPFEEKRSIIETITDKVIVSYDTIDISFSYLPEPHNLSEKGGIRQHNDKDSY